eukprot:4153493-Amphidinium_carterae.1
MESAFKDKQLQRTRQEAMSCHGKGRGEHKALQVETRSTNRMETIATNCCVHPPTSTHDVLECMVMCFGCNFSPSLTHGQADYGPSNGERQ